jgi:outer membrane lipoprotein-sorting protein
MFALGVLLITWQDMSTPLAHAAPEQLASRPDQIPAALTEKGKNLTALKAVMNITSTYDAGKSRQDVRGFLIYRRPSDFRFQGLAPAGSSLFELVIRSGRFELYVPADGKIIKGDRECFARKFPDVAEIESLIPMLLLQWKDARFDRVLSRDSDKIVIRFTFQGRIWAATLDPKNLFLKRLVRISPYGEVDLAADFSEFREGEDGWLPRKFEVQSTIGGWRTVVRISKIEINPFVVEKNFQLDPMFSAKTEECR